VPCGQASGEKKRSSPEGGRENDRHYGREDPSPGEPRSVTKVRPASDAGHEESESGQSPSRSRTRIAPMARGDHRDTKYIASCSNVGVFDEFNLQ